MAACEPCSLIKLFFYFSYGRYCTLVDTVDILWEPWTSSALLTS